MIDKLHHIMLSPPTNYKKTSQLPILIVKEVDAQHSIHGKFATGTTLIGDDDADKKMLKD